MNAKNELCSIKIGDFKDILITPSICQNFWKGINLKIIELGMH